MGQFFPETNFTLKEIKMSFATIIINTNTINVNTINNVFAGVSVFVKDE